MLKKGDVAVILGDEWAKKNIGAGMKDKLKSASEPASEEWVQLAQKKLQEEEKGKPVLTPRRSAPSGG